MSNTIIQNCSRYGTFIYDGAKVKAENCIMSNHGIHAFLLLRGGDFNFNHCHLLSYGSGDNTNAAIVVAHATKAGMCHHSEKLSRRPLVIR